MICQRCGTDTRQGNVCMSCGARLIPVGQDPRQAGQGSQPYRQPGQPGQGSQPYRQPGQPVQGGQPYRQPGQQGQGSQSHRQPGQPGKGGHSDPNREKSAKKVNTPLKVLIPILSVLVILVIVLIVVLVAKNNNDSKNGGSGTPSGSMINTEKKTDESTKKKTEATTAAVTEEKTDAATSAKTEKKTEASTEPKETATATSEKKTEEVTEAPQKTLKKDIDKIVKNVSSKKGFANDGGAKGVIGDFNGDGYKELFILYCLRTSSDASVRYEIWEFDENGANMIVGGPLFAEVGGNQGSVGIAKRDGKAYVMLSVSSPTEDKVNDSIEYTCWQKQSKAPDQAPTYRLKANGTYGSEEDMTYTVNERNVSATEYKAERNRFEMVYEMNYYDSDRSKGAVSLDKLSREYGDLTY